MSTCTTLETEVLNRILTSQFLSIAKLSIVDCPDLVKTSDALGYSPS